MKVEKDYRENEKREKKNESGKRLLREWEMCKKRMKVKIDYWENEKCVKKEWKWK